MRFQDYWPIGTSKQETSMLRDSIGGMSISASTIRPTPTRNTGGHAEWLVGKSTVQPSVKKGCTVNEIVLRFQGAHKNYYPRED